MISFSKVRRQLICDCFELHPFQQTHSLDLPKLQTIIYGNWSLQGDNNREHYLINGHDSYKNTLTMRSKCQFVQISLRSSISHIHYRERERNTSMYENCYVGK